MAGFLLVAIGSVAVVLSQPRTFEVSSIKPNLSGINQDIGINISGSRISGTNLSLRTMILQAWGLLDFQIVGGPKWLASDRFDVEASTGGAEITGKDFGPLLQSLLADRFHLVTHRETREMQTYVLVVDKGGPKLQQATGTPKNSMSGFNQRATSGRAGMVGEGVPMSALAYRLGEQEPFKGREVKDETGLAGFYDFRLEWEQSDDPAPSILAALREQLGLRLESRKGPVEVLVVDGAEKPAAN